MRQKERGNGKRDRWKKKEVWTERKDKGSKRK